jgi:hypothetical protein
MPASREYQPRSALCIVSARTNLCLSLHCGRKINGRPRAVVALDPTLLSRLAARVGAPRGLTVHKIVDLSGKELTGRTAREIETQVSHELAEVQAQAASEVQACRFRPQPNVLISLRLRNSPLGDAGVKAVAQALLLRAPLTLHMLSLSGVGASDAATRELADALTATGAVRLLSLDLSGNHLSDAAGVALAAILAAPYPSK